MKPRHTFESVVTELIDGLNSGEVNLGPAPEKQLAVSSESPLALRLPNPVYGPAASDVFISHHASDEAGEGVTYWDDMLARHLSQAVVNSTIEADMMSYAARAAFRMWVVIGDWPEHRYEVLTALQKHARAHHEVRIIITDPKRSDALLWDIEHLGLAENLRFADLRMRGWLAVTDHTLFWCRRAPFKEIQGSRGVIEIPAKSQEQSIIRVVGSMEPDSPQYYERFFDKLWNVGEKPRK
jgi:hypothetical protein